MAVTAVTKYADMFSRSKESPRRRMDTTYAGTLQFISDTYTLTGDLVGGTDGISFGKIPAGAKVYDVVVTWTDLDASGGTIDVGYLGTLTAFHSAADVTSAGSVRFAATIGMVPVASEVDLLVSINGDTDATTGTIKVTCIYALD